MKAYEGKYIQVFNKKIQKLNLTIYKYAIYMRKIIFYCEGILLH